MKELVETFKVGETIPVQIEQFKGKVIGKTGDGVTCFFNKTNTRKLKPNTIVDCKISQIKDSVLVVSEIKPPLSTIYKIGEKMTLTIEEGDKKNPIAKTKDRTVCFFDEKDTIKPQIESLSYCEITQIKETVLILRIIKIVKTSSERNKDSLTALLNKYKKH